MHIQTAKSAISDQERNEDSERGADGGPTEYSAIDAAIWSLDLTIPEKGRIEAHLHVSTLGSSTASSELSS